MEDSRKNKIGRLKETLRELRDVYDTTRKTLNHLDHSFHNIGISDLEDFQSYLEELEKGTFEDYTVGEELDDAKRTLDRIVSDLEDFYAEKYDKIRYGLIDLMSDLKHDIENIEIEIEDLED